LIEIFNEEVDYEKKYKSILLKYYDKYGLTVEKILDMPKSI